MMTEDGKKLGCHQMTTGGRQMILGGLQMMTDGRQNELGGL